MEIELPEDIQKAYTKYGYTYKLVHTGENGKDIVKEGRSKNGLSMELSSDMKTVKTVAYTHLRRRSCAYPEPL